MQSSSETTFKLDQRVHYAGQPQRTGVVKYVGPLEGYSGAWVGVDWDADGVGKHNGSHNGVAYFTARGHETASFLRPHNLSAGVSLLEALQTRYQTASTKEEEGEVTRIRFRTLFRLEEISVLCDVSLDQRIYLIELALCVFLCQQRRM